jgi:hypothetical protein
MRSRRAAGAEFVRTQLRQAQACETFLRELKASHRPTIDAPHLTGELSNPPVSADAAPISLPKELSRVIHRRRLRQLKHALADDLRSFARQPTLRADAVRRPGVESSSRHRSSVVEKREAYKERWIEQEARRAREVWKLYDNETYNLSATRAFDSHHPVQLRALHPGCNKYQSAAARVAMESKSLL